MPLPIPPEASSKARNAKLDPDQAQSRRLVAIAVPALLALAAGAVAATEGEGIVVPVVVTSSAVVAALLALLALLMNCLFTIAQTSLAALGPKSCEEILEGEDMVSRHMAGYLRKSSRLEQQLATGALFMLILLALALARIGIGAIPWIPALGAVAGMVVAFTLQLFVVEVICRNQALARPLVFFRGSVPVAAVLSQPFRLLMLPSWLFPAGVPPGSNPAALADRHLRLLPSLKGIERVLDEDAFEMIDSVRDFVATTAEEVMTPRTEVEGIPDDLSPAEVYDRLRKTVYSRLVVYHGSLDNVVGTVLAKEILLQRPKEPLKPPYLRQTLIAPESARLPELLQMIRENRTHLVVVIDEYGGMSGIVTLHDLLEVIVGHIQDVEDEGELWIEKLDDKTYRLNGRVEIWELNEELDLELDEETARTIGGVVFHHLARMPENGDEVRIGPIRIRVDEARDNRVEVVTIEFEAAEPASAGEKE